MDVRGPEPVAARLRRAGRRATPQRLAVYQALAALSGHQSAEDVYGALRARGTRLSRASVYAALDVLGRVGLVMVADAGPGRALYEVAEVWHHHAVCRSCGAISDVRCAIGHKPCLDPPAGWGDVDEAQVIFRGRCRACLDRSGARGERTGREGAGSALRRANSAAHAG